MFRILATDFVPFPCGIPMLTLSICGSSMWSAFMCSQICSSQQECDVLFSKLKLTPCPHCKTVGNLVKHGFLRGYDAQHLNDKTVRASRVFCSNRRANDCGCGRTFSVWIADKIKNLSLSSQQLWTFLTGTLSSGNKLDAFRKLDCKLGLLATYRIWRRFTNAQAAIRTTLMGLCEPPRITSECPAQLTLAHLQKAFKEHPLSPIAAYQATLKTFFM
jgi:hypothetical protein